MNAERQTADDPCPSTAGGILSMVDAASSEQGLGAEAERLRQQLGEAIWQERLGEARARQTLIEPVLAAVAGGSSFAAACRTHASQMDAETVQKWISRWRVEGLWGLVSRRSGAPRKKPESGPPAPVAQMGFADLLSRPVSSTAPRQRLSSRAGLTAFALVKWSGSKAPILPLLLPLVPQRFEHYHEPFLGSGALYFALRPKHAFLADLNAELVNLYRVTRDQPAALLDALAGYVNTRKHYMEARGVEPNGLPPVERAARTLFLNRTCFNGLYRVNRAGLFNTPYGSQERTTCYQPSAIWRCHSALAGTEISCADFEASTANARPGDFVYLDPPYVGSDARYQRDGFTEADQSRVAALARELDRRGCLVMVSNADCPLVRDLYRGFELTPISAIRRVRGGERARAAELVIRNYAGPSGLLDFDGGPA